MHTLSSLMTVLLLVALLLGLGVAAMAVGVMFKRPCLRGSCGGPAVHTADGEKISCASCPNRHKHAQTPAHPRQGDHGASAEQDG